MFLTASNLFFYLEDRGLIDPQAVMAGDLHIVARESRHRSFAVLRWGGPSYFIKQIKTWKGDAAQTLQAEADWIRLATEDPLLAGLAPWVPRYLDYDPDRRVLVVEWLAGVPLPARWADEPLPTVAGAAQLGAALGRLQRDLAAEWPGGRPPAHFPPTRLWVLNGPELPGDSPGQSAGQAQLLAALRRYPAFAVRLADLRATWEPDMLIHADMKWDNWLYADGAFKIVDWEFAGRGDAAWDAGTLLQWYLTWWATTGAGSDAGGSTAAVMRGCISAFWRAYLAGRGLDLPAARVLRERVFACAAARLIQSAYELLYGAPQLSPAAVRLLQLSLNILENPRAAIQELLEPE